LDNIKEGDLGLSKDKNQTRHLLDGFKQLGVKIHLLSGSIDKLYTKKKFHGLFDIGVLSVHSANRISKEFTTLFKDSARVHCESADYLLVLKPEQRVEFRQKVLEKVKESDWKVIHPPPSKHHFLLEVSNDKAVRAGEASTAADTEIDEEDYLNLDGL